MVQGEDMALISDAGTPLLSDPGARLVGLAREAGVRVVPVPGASALLAALVASGLGTDRFTFYGFLPRKGRERTETVGSIVGLTHAAVLYEAANRVAATLADLAEAGAEGREAVVARELTKQYEEVRRGTVGELARYYEESPPRGEIVIVVAGGVAAAPDEALLRSEARAMRVEGLGARDVAAALVDRFGIARNLAYRIAHE
jgi:16S rRNA (cytidine1402-2'-O)-methyltransferase